MAESQVMRSWPAIVILAGTLSACTSSREAAPTNATPATPQPISLKAIPVAAPRPAGEPSRMDQAGNGDLDAVIERGYLRVLVARSRTHFENNHGQVRGRAVDVGVALAEMLSQRTAAKVSVIFIETVEDALIRDLLAGRGDVAANLRLTFERDDQVAFAPPVRSGIRELVVTELSAPLVSLEDVGGRAIHVRKNSDHHASLLRLNQQLTTIHRPPARVVAEEEIATDEDLLGRVNDGHIPATIADDYIFDLWRKEFPKITANRDVAVSQDGSLSWVTRKNAPNLLAIINEFFSTHRLTF
jgi:membrane-bound lytic murein transglycosylase MltF